MADTSPASAVRTCWSGSFIQNTTLTVNGKTTDPMSGFFHEHDVVGEFNWALEVVYLAVLALQVVLALGNRPKGERLTCAWPLIVVLTPVDALSFWFFAFCSLYLIVNTVVLTVKAWCPFSAYVSQSGGVFKVLLGNNFSAIIAGIIGTFGIYIISSFLCA